MKTEIWNKSYAERLHLTFLPIFLGPKRRGGSDQGSVSLSAFCLMYSELVQYHQTRVASISELERRLESSGYSVGFRVLELLAYRSKEVRYFL